MRNRPLDEKNETTVAGVYLKKFHLSDKFLHRVSKKRRKKNENSADLANPIQRLTKMEEVNSKPIDVKYGYRQL